MRAFSKTAFELLGSSIKSVRPLGNPALPPFLAVQRPSIPVSPLSFAVLNSLGMGSLSSGIGGLQGSGGVGLGFLSGDFLSGERVYLVGFLCLLVRASLGSGFTVLAIVQLGSEVVGKLAKERFVFWERGRGNLFL